MALNITADIITGLHIQKQQNHCGAFLIINKGKKVLMFHKSLIAQNIIFSIIYSQHIYLN